MDSRPTDQKVERTPGQGVIHGPEQKGPWKDWAIAVVDDGDGMNEPFSLGVCAEEVN